VRGRCVSIFDPFHGDGAVPSACTSTRCDISSYLLFLSRPMRDVDLSVRPRYSYFVWSVHIYTLAVSALL
jgi:hypothetical protein